MCARVRARACARVCVYARVRVCMRDVFAIYTITYLIIIKISILYFIQIRHSKSDDFPSTGPIPASNNNNTVAIIVILVILINNTNVQ